MINVIAWSHIPTNELECDLLYTNVKINNTQAELFELSDFDIKDKVNLNYKLIKALIYKSKLKEVLTYRYKHKIN